MKKTTRFLSLFIAMAMTFSAGTVITSAESVISDSIVADDLFTPVSSYSGNNAIYDDGEVIVYKDGTGHYVNSRYNLKMSYVVKKTDAVITLDYFGLSDKYTLEMTASDEKTETYTVTAETVEELNSLYEAADQLYVVGTENSIIDAYKQFTYSYGCITDGNTAFIQFKGTETDFVLSDYINVRNKSFTSCYYDEDENRYNIRYKDNFGYVELRKLKEALADNENIEEFTINETVCEVAHSPEISITYLSAENTGTGRPAGASELYGDYLTYQPVDTDADDVADAVEIIRCDKSVETIRVPSSIKGLKVIIGKEAFKGCTALTDINLAPGIETIGARAFSGTAIKEIVFPKSVSYIGMDAFEYCDNLRRTTVKNSECEIYPSFNTLAYVSKAYSYSLNTIVCYENSTAQKYALACGNNYNTIIDTKAEGKIVTFDDGKVIVYDANRGRYTYDREAFVMNYTVPHNDGIMNNEYFNLPEKYQLILTEYTDTTETYSVKAESYEELCELYENGMQLYKDGVISDGYKEFSYDHNCLSGFTVDLTLKEEDPDFTLSDINELAIYKYVQSKDDPKVYTITGLFNEQQYALIMGLKDKILAYDNVESFEVNNLVRCAVYYYPQTVYIYLSDENQLVTEKTSIATMYGDITEDGDVGMADAVVFSKYQMNNELYPFGSEIAYANADINNDGNINILDMSVLVEYLTGEVKLPEI